MPKLHPSSYLNYFCISIYIKSTVILFKKSLYNKFHCLLTSKSSQRKKIDKEKIWLPGSTKFSLAIFWKKKKRRNIFLWIIDFKIYHFIHLILQYNWHSYLYPFPWHNIKSYLWFLPLPEPSASSVSAPWWWEPGSSSWWQWCVLGAEPCPRYPPVSSLFSHPARFWRRKPSPVLLASGGILSLLSCFPQPPVEWKYSHTLTLIVQCKL